MSVSYTILDEHSQAEVARWFDHDQVVVACLCAAWCDTCRAYQTSFDQLTTQHPDKKFVWIDIEDQADLLGDIDVENFPTLLIQRGNTVTFFGTVLPDAKLADRLIRVQAEKDASALAADAATAMQKSGLHTRLIR